MNAVDIVQSFWNEIHRQNWEELSGYFMPDATIDWENTNERFSVQGFVRANSEYPGKWAITIKRIDTLPHGVVSVVRVEMAEHPVSFYATSFFAFTGGRIQRLTEYWGENGDAPQWRRELGIGQPIR